MSKLESQRAKWWAQICFPAETHVHIVVIGIVSEGDVVHMFVIGREERGDNITSEGEGEGNKTRQ